MKPIVILLMGALFPMSGFAQTVGSYCLYTHDNVGNIISREKALSQNRGVFPTKKLQAEMPVQTAL